MIEKKSQCCEKVEHRQTRGDDVHEYKRGKATETRLPYQATARDRVVLPKDSTRFSGIVLPAAEKAADKVEEITKKRNPEFQAKKIEKQGEKLTHGTAHLLYGVGSHILVP